MENAQINAAMIEYERLLGDETDDPTVMDVIDCITPDVWWSDMADYLAPDTFGQGATLLAAIRAAIAAQERGDRQMYDLHCGYVGKLVCETVEGNALHRWRDKV